MSEKIRRHIVGEFYERIRKYESVKMAVNWVLNEHGVPRRTLYRWVTGK